MRLLVLLLSLTATHSAAADKMIVNYSADFGYDGQIEVRMYPPLPIDPSKAEKELAKISRAGSASVNVEKGDTVVILKIKTPQGFSGPEPYWKGLAEKDWQPYGVAYKVIEIMKRQVRGRYEFVKDPRIPVDPKRFQ